MNGERGAKNKDDLISFRGAVLSHRCAGWSEHPLHVVDNALNGTPLLTRISLAAPPQQRPCESPPWASRRRLCLRVALGRLWLPAPPAPSSTRRRSIQEARRRDSASSLLTRRITARGRGGRGCTCHGLISGTQLCTDRVAYVYT